MTENSSRLNETPLESWKEIATYLKRDVRTVKRWEKSEGLPVHRHLHQARSSVYAYPSELDAWWATRQPHLEEIAPVAMPWRHLRPALGLIAMLLLAMVSVGNGTILTQVGSAAQEPASDSRMMARRVWAGPEVDLEGAVSPDGRYLTFVDWSTGDLALRDLVTGKNRRLTNKGPWTESPEYAEVSVPSPDAQKIAYAWFNGEFYDLRLIGLDASGPRVLYRNQDVEYLEPGGWSPDGKYVSVTLSKADKTNQIVLVSVADGSARVLKSFDSRHAHLGPFSPDGRYIVYDFPPEEDSPQRDIFLLATDGSREIRLVEHPANDRVLAWTPDGERFLFSSDRTGTNGAWLIQVTGGKPQGAPELVRPALGRFGPLGLTGEGAFYYGVAAGIRDAYMATFDPVTGRVAGPPTPVSQRFVGSNTLPAWSPDGKYLAYLSRRGSVPDSLGPPVLVIRSLVTGEEREVSPKLTFQPPWSPLSWFPDDRFILAAGSVKSRQGLYQIDAQTGEVTPIVRSEPGTRAVLPAVSPDGKTIFYLREELATETSTIVARDVESGRGKVVYRAAKPDLVNNFAVSPDGQRLAFALFERTAGSEALKVLPTAGGEPRDLLRIQVPKKQDHSISGWAGVAWTPDGAHLLFARWVNYVQGDPTVEFWRVPAEGGEPQKLGLATERPWGLRLHPDGRRIAFTAGSLKTEVWVLENFLPALKAAQ